jgi:hypothetical protein
MLNKGKGSLDNGFSNKYKKILKNRKEIIDMFLYLYISGDSNFI